MATCPRCKEDMPLLSKICTTCGYVEEGKGDDKIMSPTEVVTVLEKILHAIKTIPQPSFGKGMGQLSYIMLPLFAIIALIIALMSEAGLFWILFLLFAAFSIVAILRKSKGKLGNDPFNAQFREHKNDYQYFERMAKRDFGKSREITTLLEEISTEIASIEKKRKSASSRNLIVWSIILVVMIALGAFSIMATSKVVNDPSNLPAIEQVPAYAASGEWQKAVEAYKLTDAESMEAPSMRQTVVGAILAAGESAAAEDFFVSSCMGQLKDVDCARQIVEHYKANAQPDAAKAFLVRCTAMRYSTDIEKLKKILL